MKQSKYNVFATNDAGSFVVNTFSGSMMQLDNQPFELLRNSQIDKFALKETELLKENGFIVEDSCDEFAVVKHLFRQSRYSHNYLSLTIVPTFGCNFACTYCYEKDMTGKMNEQLWQSIINYLGTVEPEYSHISICFYGGEPLLELGAILDFLDRIKDTNQKIYNKLSLTMISNGYLLDKPAVDKLAAHGMQNVQITVDGNKQTHNLRRPHRLYNDSYEKIIANISYAINHLHVLIRMNVDMHNSESDIQQILTDIGHPQGHCNLDVYAGKLTDIDKKEDFSPMSDIEFHECSINVFNQANSVHATEFSMASLKLHPLETSCSADAYDNFVILPDGKITNCWNNLASINELSDNLIGNLENGKMNINLSKLASWFDKTDLENIHPECKACVYLPVCLGGCPKARGAQMMDCCYAKNLLDKCIEVAYKNLTTD